MPLQCSRPIYLLIYLFLAALNFLRIKKKCILCPCVGQKTTLGVSTLSTHRAPGIELTAAGLLTSTFLPVEPSLKLLEEHL